MLFRSLGHRSDASEQVLPVLVSRRRARVRVEVRGVIDVRGQLRAGQELPVLSLAPQGRVLVRTAAGPILAPIFFLLVGGRKREEAWGRTEESSATASGSYGSHLPYGNLHPDSGHVCVESW